MKNFDNTCNIMSWYAVQQTNPTKLEERMLNTQRDFQENRIAHEKPRDIRKGDVINILDCVDIVCA